MNKQQIFLFVLGVLLVAGLHWALHDTAKGLEEKIIYQRRLLNELKQDIRQLREEVHVVQHRDGWQQPEVIDVER